jgi:DNA-binding SARP family transcriptional activator
MGVLRISLFGSYEVCNSDPTSVSVKLTRTIQSLLAYFLLEPRLHSREALAGMFWKEFDTGRARNCLNTALWRLRQALEPGNTPAGAYLLTNPYGDVGFNWESNHWLDVEIFEKSLKPAIQSPPGGSGWKIQQIEEVLDLYSGDLLEGFYDDWVLQEREIYRRLYLNGLAYLMQAYRDQHRYEKSLACGQKLLYLEPLREEVHREMMRLFAENGQRSLALQQYETCRQVLKQELGISPMEETDRLYHQLLTNGPAAVSFTSPGQASSAPAEFHQALFQFQNALKKLAEVQRDLQEAIQKFGQLSEKED